MNHVHCTHGFVNKSTKSFTFTFTFSFSRRWKTWNSVSGTSIFFITHNFSLFPFSTSPVSRSLCCPGLGFFWVPLGTFKITWKEHQTKLHTKIHGIQNSEFSPFERKQFLQFLSSFHFASKQNIEKQNLDAFTSCVRERTFSLNYKYQRQNLGDQPTTN